MSVKKNVAISDSGFIYNPDTGESFSSNIIGVEILTMLRQNLNFDEIKEKVLEKYYTDEPTFERDYNDFIFSLNQFQLIKEDE